MCKRGNRLFLLRYGFGYLTTIYKFCDLELLAQPFFSIPTTRRKKMYHQSGSNLVQNCFPFVFVVKLASTNTRYGYRSMYGCGLVNEEECRCVIMAINIQLCDYDKDLVYSNTK